jgi:hypothetical protein
MKNRIKKYSANIQHKINNIKNSENTKLIFMNKKNEIIELVNNKKEDIETKNNDIKDLINLSKALQMKLISKYRNKMDELPDSKFILNIIIDYPIAKCDPENNSFIELLYGLWRSNLINKASKNPG